MLDHITLVNEVIGILKKFDLASLHMQNTLDMLLQLQPDLKKLEVHYGKHPYTKKLNIDEGRRLKLVGIISFQMQLLRRADIESERESVKIVAHEVERFLLGIRKNNQDVITELTLQFFQLIDEKEEVQIAFEELGFQRYLDELRLVNINYEDMYMKRSNSISHQTKWDNKLLIQKKCQAVLRNIFETIELTQTLYPNVEYSPIIDLLNTTLVRFNKHINRRATYNKKRAEAVAKEVQQAEPQTHILSVDGKETGSVTIGGKKEVKKKKGRRSYTKQAKKQNSKSSTNETQPPKKDNPIDGLLNILKLPPGNRN